jgi:hypothetical protein
MKIIEFVGQALAGLARSLTRSRRPARRAKRRAEPTQAHADERTIRRAGEAELGGRSSEESRAAYERGDNPGGIHHGGRGPETPHRGTERGVEP